MSEKRPYTEEELEEMRKKDEQMWVEQYRKGIESLVKDRSGGCGRKKKGDEWIISCEGNIDRSLDALKDWITEVDDEITKIKHHKLPREQDINLQELEARKKAIQKKLHEVKQLKTEGKVMILGENDALSIDEIIDLNLKSGCNLLLFPFRL